MPNPGHAAEPIDFSTVTEGPGARGSRQQLARLCSRYYFASQHAAGKDVLEAACGCGAGLGLLARKSKRTVGLDLEAKNVAIARSHYRSRVEILEGDAEALPFSNEEFDLVLLYEAIYYLNRPDHFVREAHRVLRPSGTLIICSANKDLPDFNPSPYARRYFGPPEITGLLSEQGFSVQCLGEDPVGSTSLRQATLQMVKRTAVQLGLIPKSMVGKAVLKRLVFGSLVEIPAEVEEGMAPVRRPQTISSDKPDRVHRVLYAVGRKGI